MSENRSIDYPAVYLSFRHGPDFCYMDMVWYDSECLKYETG